MNVIPLPTATIDDSEVACALRRAVGVINPLLDVLSGADPLGIKSRTRDAGESNGVTDGVLDALAWMANTADVPGTAAWDDMDVDARINWWVRRVGALDTLVVAFPGVFGVVADTLPVQDLLGFSSQSIVLCAVAREHGVDDTAQQVRMLAAVLCDRDLGSHTDQQDAAASNAEDTSSTGFAPAAAVWHLAGVMRAVGDELLKRPRPRRIFRYLGMLPAAGVVADYLGEYGALVRASKQGRGWLAESGAWAAV